MTKFFGRKLPRISLGGFARWFKGGKTTLDDARKILGKDNIVSLLNGEHEIVYPRETLEFCATQNAHETEWHWVLFGKTEHSLQKQQVTHPREFSRASVWGIKPAWIDITSEPGYRLVNIRPLLRGKTLKQREEYLREHPHYAVAHLQTVAELLIAWKNIHDERLLGDCYHCGDVIFDFVPILGEYTTSGMLLTALPQEVVETLGMPSMGSLLCIVPGVIIPKHNPATT